MCDHLPQSILTKTVLVGDSEQAYSIDKRESRYFLGRTTYEYFDIFILHLVLLLIFSHTLSSMRAWTCWLQFSQLWHLDTFSEQISVYSFTDTLDRTLGDKRHLVTVELEAKPTETSSVVPVIEYAASISEDILKGSQEAIENGIHSACLQGKVPWIRVSMNIIISHSQYYRLFQSLFPSCVCYAFYNYPIVLGYSVLFCFVLF